MQTLVAIYPTRAEAERVKLRLVECGIADRRIALSPEHDGTDGASRGEDRRSWWDWLFGSDVPEDHRAWYDSNLREGRTALSVYLDDGTRRVEIEEILHREGALDGPTVDSPAVDTMAATTRPQASSAASERRDEQHIPVVEEQLEVGKRQREERYRVHVYTTERPVEETVNLRDERVVIERRPVVDGGTGRIEQPATRDFEVVEKHEEAVVAKKAKVTEEVVVRKDVSDRTETVSDTVRETHVDVDPPARGSTAGRKGRSPSP